MYIIITAPGCYGTYSRVHSRHASLEDALKRKGRNRRVMVTTDGGWSETHKVGARIHRADAEKYESLG